MTCDTAIELLPWLLNDTLAAGERDEIWHHLKTCERCRQTLAETRDAWSVFAQHLPSQSLVALAWGEVPSEAVEEHLTSCARCAAELELARMSRRLEEAENIAVFPTPRPPGEARRWRSAALAAGLTGLMAISGWLYTAQRASELSSRLAERPVAAPATSGVDRGADKRLAAMNAELDRLRSSQKALEEQAKKASDQLAQMESAPRGLGEPQLNAWSDLVSLDVVRSGAPEKEVVIPSNRAATPMLEASGGGGLRDIEILDSTRTVLWKSSGLRSTSEDDYRITFPPGFLKPGRYTIQLYATADGKRVPRESYRIRVQ
jgi:hypothetical protein